MCVDTPDRFVMSTGIMSCLPAPLLLLLMLLPSVVPYVTTTSDAIALRDLIAEVVTDIVRENCAGPEPDLSLHARILVSQQRRAGTGRDHAGDGNREAPCNAVSTGSTGY